MGCMRSDKSRTKRSTSDTKLKERREGKRVTDESSASVSARRSGVVVVHRPARAAGYKLDATVTLYSRTR